MTVTFLTLNKSISDIDTLIFPTEPADLKGKLSFKWTLWAQAEVDQTQPGEYKDATKQIHSFDTVESFWATFEHIPQPSRFAQGESSYVDKQLITSLMLFRDGVAPEWEDPVNANGGHFQFQWRPNSVAPEQLDEYWNNLVLGIVGDTIESEGEFSHSRIIQGVRFVDKLRAPGKQAGVRMEVWFSKTDDQRHLQKIRSRLEKAMAVHINGSTGTVPRCDVRYHSNRH